KLSQLKKLSFQEIKEEFDKLVQQIDTFVPMDTEASLKRQGSRLDKDTSKKQKVDTEGVSITKEKDEVVKDEEAEVPVKKVGIRRKQKARKGMKTVKDAQDKSKEE
ncbi:hypothetical protein Tco_0541716, partial [Tanacetum coccineum]